MNVFFVKIFADYVKNRQTLEFFEIYINSNLGFVFFFIHPVYFL